MSEFELIRRFFTRPGPSGVLGVGDDCALLPSSPGAWAVSTDMLLENRHFFSDVAPDALGHKALAVNLSDLAAMGAAPRGFVLGLALPAVRPEWLQGFSEGMYALADRHGCPLVGGDTTRSEAGICISVTVFGALDARQALRRDAARPGDDIWVSGALGEADVALRLLLAERSTADGARVQSDAAGQPTPAHTETPQSLPDDAAVGALLQRLESGERAALLAAIRHRLERPEPRVPLGLALAGIAHAAIDISDGLLQDLGHIAAASRCRARIDVASLPTGLLDGWLPPGIGWRCALAGGDAYELCFTAPASRRARIERAAQRLGIAVTRIGCIEEGEGVCVLGPDGLLLKNLPGGFDHFAS